MTANMFDEAQLRVELIDDLAALEREAVEIYERVVLPNRASGKLSSGRTIHAYMMALMARVDLASTYWYGPGGSQTSRMKSFLEKYVCSDAEVNQVLVKMWRHTLMHTGKPRGLTRRKGDPYYWLLHWRDDLPRPDHFTFLDEAGMRKLNIGLLYFVGDLRRGFDNYVHDAKNDPALMRKATAAHSNILSQAKI